MDYTNIEEIKETHRAGEVNSLLHTGWKLLAIHPARNPRHNALYILGARTATLMTPPAALPDPTLKIDPVA